MAQTAIEEYTYRKVGFDRVREELALQAESALGAEKCRALAPLDGMDTIRAAQTETDEASSYLERFGDLTLNNLLDIRTELDKAKVRLQLSGQEVWKIAVVLGELSRVRKAFVTIKDLYPSLFSISQDVKPFSSLDQEIERCVNQDGDILDDASINIAAIRREKIELQKTINKVLQDILANEAYGRAVQDRIITTRNDRYVIPVKREFKDTIQSVVHDQSDSGMTLFVEPTRVIDLNNRLQILQSDEKKEISRILLYLTDLIAKATPDIEKSLDVAGHLDFTLAKGRLARLWHAVKPSITPNLETSLRNVRNPFVENCVPISFAIGKDYFMVVITGPNTGGKTVTLKTLGLTVLCSKAGLFIPASEGCSVGLYDNVYVDIGDEQSIEQSLSTFSAHMSNIVRILEQATRYSLVLLDELGVGTDPEEGSAIATGIVDFLYQKRITTVITTHYSSLKLLAYRYEQVRNASVGFDVETLRPTYELILGSPGESHAFTICERLGLPEAVLALAHDELSNEHKATTELMSRIVTDSQEISHTKETLNVNQQELEKLREDYERKLALLEANEKQELKTAHAEAQRIVDDVSRRMDDLMKQYQEALKNQPQAAHDVKQAVLETRDELVQKAEPYEDKPAFTPVEEILPGDLVIITSVNKQAIVIDVMKDKRKLILQSGSMRTTVPEAQVRKLTDAELNSYQSRAMQYSGTREPTLPFVPMKIDLHGSRVDEALEKLDKYIDVAYLSGLSFVYIVHGKGAGILRKQIHEFLKTLPSIDHFSFSSPEEGGDGVTIAYFK
ncbi:MAG: endonuclease MutS2 [Candidatus Cryosericum sp.]